MKNIIFIILLAVVSIGFSACGDSSSGISDTNKSNEDINESNASVVTPDIVLETIPISSECNVSNIANYTTLQEGDRVKKNEENTTVNIYHDEEDNKKICVESGSASIVREVE